MRRLNASETTLRFAVLAAAWMATLFSFLLPDIDLSSRAAEMVVLVTDTAAWPVLPLLSVAALIMVVSRPRVPRERRKMESVAMAAVLVVALGGNAALNEFVVKPAFGIPRPNIEMLAESGALGPEFPDAETFYQVGGKEARREVLGERLPLIEAPLLADRVEASWIHETGYSFPSGHATAAMTLASLLVSLAFAWLTGWRHLVVTVAAPVWAVGIAYSRVLLGVHRPVDVVVGTAAGILWGLLAFWAIQRLVGRPTPRSTAPPA